MTLRDHDLGSQGAEVDCDEEALLVVWRGNGGSEAFSAGVSTCCGWVVVACCCWFEGVIEDGVCCTWDGCSQSEGMVSS
jgi:hypothetical protein